VLVVTLASVDPQNGTWSITTKREEVKEGKINTWKGCR
jgi:hypothetical protein